MNLVQRGHRPLYIKLRQTKRLVSYVFIKDSAKDSLRKVAEPKSRTKFLKYFCLKLLIWLLSVKCSDILTVVFMKRRAVS